ncbi:TetR family transcriptional regulator [Lacticaseibacillus camelliae DSM 22697 = JCM 13995]|uniref:TetR family transcriptional regulator n=2 Tax=Lacticaseibacillus camelliae TaxID=381742 RepID=A0A0R2FAS1_9LACO|nr:TetR family transcriptional regulator [Lacticaseibacillus camelliae DSM 22697 = JCM 13995]
MVLPTFEHLDEEKQARIRQALLNEFSHYSLADAQVARIVKDAGIARGAFYKYFTDLTDAYRYLFGIAMREIHQGMPKRPTAGNVDEYIAALRQFIETTSQCEYRDLIQQHFRYNEGYLGETPTRLIPGGDAKQWAFTVLYHQTVKDIMLAPDTAEARIAQLRIALTRGSEGE